MFKPIHHNTATLRGPNVVRAASIKRCLFSITLALVCFSLPPAARAINPPPDGGYPGENTAEGTNALFNLDPRVARDNTAVGSEALFSVTIQELNTAVGSHALHNSDTSANTAVGAYALSENRFGGQNTATGAFALRDNNGGFNGTATGTLALSDNTIGQNNTATGAFALASNETGSFNTATGSSALTFNKTGEFNTVSGYLALFENGTGSHNTGTGAFAMFRSESGSNNTATGDGALTSDTDFGFRVPGGDNNTATGASALARNTTGNENTATGVRALRRNEKGNNNTADGVGALANNTGSNNIALGHRAGVRLTTGNNNIHIGAQGFAGESNTIRIGAIGIQKSAYIQGITGATVPSGVPVIVDTQGHLGTIISSERVKEEIKPMDRASEAILNLKPVTFRYKKELDPQGIRQFGLVAEQVEKANPDLVAHDAEGKVYTVRYEAVSAMLLNEFLKEHQKVESLEATVARQQNQIEALSAGLQRVTAQVASSKPAPRIAINNQ